MRLNRAMAFPDSSDERSAAIRSIADAAYTEHDLASLIVQVRIGGEVISEFAQGAAMSGVPATTGDHFRNGAVAIAYLAAALLRLDERRELGLDKPIAPHLPGFPAADVVTPRMLISMTSGYPDYVADQRFVDAWAANPFRAWTAEELIEFSTTSQRLFAPGTNWDYSHSGIVILGRVIEAATRKPLAQVLADEVLTPAGLTHTVSEQTARIPDPIQHGFTAERGIYEDATFWNPSWTLAEGAVQTTTIDDMARSFDAIVGGEGSVLKPESRAQMIDPRLVGFGAPLEGCRSCHTLTRDFAYGLGVFLIGDWVAQSPLFGGYSAAVMTLPKDRRGAEEGAVTIAVAGVVGESGHDDWTGDLENYPASIASRIAAELVPANPPRQSP